MKLCINCTHHNGRNYCARKATQVISLVTGRSEIKGKMLDCFAERRPRWVDSCNREAKYFVQKEPLVPPSGGSAVMGPTEKSSIPVPRSPSPPKDPGPGVIH